MKSYLYIFFLAFLGIRGLSQSQTLTFKENGKWGIKENENPIIPARFDTIFNFDSTGKVCLACFKIVTSSPNKFIKVISTSYSCNYLNKKNQRLVIRNQQNDTCGVFSLGKNTLKQYLNKDYYFTAGTKSKKFLVDKDFRQITFKGYHDIRFCEEPKFYMAQMINEGDMVVAGLLNEREEVLIAFEYSSLKLNTRDSLIVACSAGLKLKTEDDIFNYEGKKLISSHRHVDLATKNFLVQHVFEPKEYFVIYNILTREEKILNADEANLYQENEILIRIKRDWFIYNMVSGEKRPFKQT